MHVAPHFSSNQLSMRAIATAASRRARALDSAISQQRVVYRAAYRQLSSEGASTSSANTTNVGPIILASGVLGVALGGYTLATRTPESGGLFSSFTSSRGVLDPAEDACAGDSDDLRARRIRRWLELHGAYFAKCDLKAAPHDAGVSVFYEGGEKDHVSLSPAKLSVKLRGKEQMLMLTPDAAVVNAQTACQHPTLGGTFRELLRDGTLDERLATMCFLMLERRKGEESVWKEYIDALPRNYDTPLYVSNEELDRELKGTNLHAAAMAQKEDIKKVFDERIRPAMRTLTQADNAAGGSLHVLPEVSAKEFRWAYATFWSRAVAIPLAGGVVSESIIPGIDMANHSSAGTNARWEHIEDPSRPDGGFVALVSPSNRRLAQGEEVFINYGADKSNEELIFTYGFASPTAGNEVPLVLLPPWSTISEHSEDVNRRIRLLRSRRLPERVTLPHLPPRRGIRDLKDPQTAEILKIWVSPIEDDPHTGPRLAPASASSSIASSVHAALRAELGRASAALRAIQQSPQDSAHTTRRSRMYDRYRRDLRDALDAYLDAAQRWA